MRVDNLIPPPVMVGLSDLDAYAARKVALQHAFYFTGNNNPEAVAKEATHLHIMGPAFLDDTEKAFSNALMMWARFLWRRNEETRTAYLDALRAYAALIAPAYERSNKDVQGAVLGGVPIVYGQRTKLLDFLEVIEDGALDGADLSDVRLLVNHDDNALPLARARGTLTSTMRLFIVPGVGLVVRALLDTANSQAARDVAACLDRGDCSGMSFRFSTELDHVTGGVRHIDKIKKVLEVSVCTFPAYPQTSVNAMG